MWCQFGEQRVLEEPGPAFGGLPLAWWWGFFSAVGVVLGPFAGAFVGELAGNADSGNAFRSALGAFFGLMTGVVLKLIVSGVFTWYFVKEWMF